MGEISEDMLDGTCCQLCGCYFGTQKDEYLYTHGYPVVCWDCYDDITDSGALQYQRADVETL